MALFYLTAAGEEGSEEDKAVIGDQDENTSYNSECGSTQDQRICEKDQTKGYLEIEDD